MTAVNDTTYLPRLEECLDGKTTVLSWRTIASALSDTARDRPHSPAIAKFLRDPYVHGLLKAPATVFGARTAESTRDFEARTAAIHVTPTPNDLYDINEIKADSLWLSEIVEINEIAALRIVAIEFQSRPRSHLTGPLSTQDIANIQEATGLSNVQASSLLTSLNISPSLEAEHIWNDFNAQGARRQRLITTYLSDRRHFMMAADHLLSFIVHMKPENLGAEAEPMRQVLLRGVVGQHEDYGAFEQFVTPYLEMLPRLIERSQSCPALVSTLSSSVDLELDWATSFLSEVVHGMSMLFQILDSAGGLFASQDVVGRWWTLMDNYAFLDQLTGLPEFLAPAKTLVCVISLALLNLDRSLPYLAGDIDLHEQEDPYLQDSNLLTQIHATVSAAAEAGLHTAGPVVFAWTLIVHRLYAEYQERAERRDMAQNQRAQDGFELDMQPSGARRNSAGSVVSIENSPYDLFLVTQSLDRDIQPVERLAVVVTAQGQIYDVMTDMAHCMGETRDAAFRPLLGSRMRLVFLDFLKQSYPFIGYQADPVTCLSVVLSGGQSYWDLDRGLRFDPEMAVTTAALRDESFKLLYLQQALARYPYEFAPFVSLCRILRTNRCKDEHTEAIRTLIDAVPSLTFELPRDWVSFELTYEEDNANTFQLTEPLYVFNSTTTWKRKDGWDDPFRIPAGTPGRFVSDASKVAMIEFHHDLLALLRKQLEARISPDLTKSALKPLDGSDLTEAITLAAVCLRMPTLEEDNDVDGMALPSGLALVETKNREALRREDDFVAIVCNIIDMLLQDDLANSDGTDIAILSSSLQLLHAALSVFPGRVWAYLARSELLNSESRAGRLSRITGSLDLVDERFDFITCALKFFAGLVDSALKGGVQRKSGADPNGRQRGSETSWSGTSDRILMQICFSVAQATVDILENTTTWRFQSDMHRSSVVGDAVNVLNKCVSYAFSMGSREAVDTDAVDQARRLARDKNAEPTAKDQGAGLTACFLPAADYVLDSFLTESFGPLRFQPLLTALIIGLQLPDSTLYLDRQQDVSETISAILVFLTAILRVARYRDKSLTAIQTQMFKSASLFARLCAVQVSFRGPVFALLGALVENAGSGDAEPSSLLGYLGPHISRSFLQIMSRMDQPYNRHDEVAAIWKFLSTVMRNRQQLMANCLLTGKAPRDALQKDGNFKKIPSDSVLARAMESMRTITGLPSREVLAVLEFFTAAQNHWPWIIFSIQEETTVFDALRSYIRSRRPPSVVAKSDPERAALETRIAAYIAECFAMQLYHLRQMGQDSRLAADVLSDVDYFLRDGVQISAYNTSLHVNFAKNFAARYQKCTLDDFKRTMLFPRELGPHYFYATEDAQTILSYDFGWTGGIKRQGFKYEMETANLNLSLVEAEVALFRSWEYLLLELSTCLLPQNLTIARQMQQVAEKCLESNQASQPPENFFSRLKHSRAELALTLLQRLAEHSLLPKDGSQLLQSIWNTVCAEENPFTEAQLPYYRTLLRILFVVLRGSSHNLNSNAAAQETASAGSVAVTQLILSILDRVVAQGFRTLVTLVHEADSPTTPEDVALLTAILQASLSVAGMEQCQNQILNIMASYDVFHVAISLFSWADKLAVNGDPVYGELALLFLLELSALPVLAEQLAADGLLGHVTSANLAGFIRRDNVSPFAESAGAVRCYGIWAKALLPLLLNILGVLGGTIAPEIAFVLNQFPNLLSSSVKRFEAPGLSRTTPSSSVRGGGGGGTGGGPQHCVTLLAVSEAHSLALLVRVLNTLRQNNGGRTVPEVRWDGAALLESVEFWLASRRVLLDRLLPLGAREAEWRGLKAAEGSGCDNRLEEKVVAGLEAVREVLSEEVE